MGDLSFADVLAAARLVLAVAEAVEGEEPIGEAGLSPRWQVRRGAEGLL